jgi:FkbM family methyltransferase
VTTQRPRSSTLVTRCLWGVTLGKNMLAQGIRGLGADLRMLAQRPNGHIVFRQTAMHGFQMLVRADEAVGRRIYYGKSFENDETEFFLGNVRDTDVCIDVGANIGYYTLLFAKLAPRGKVVAFEPVPMTYHMLSVNLLANGVTNAVVSTLVIGDSEKDVNFVVSRDGAFSSLVDTGREPTQRMICVPMTSLDGYCADQGITRVDVLKVDVEGAETRVIEGASNLFENASRRPRIVMLELHEAMLRQHGSSISHAVHLMEGYGYQPFVFIGGKAIPFTRECYGLSENVFFLRDCPRNSTR